MRSRKGFASFEVRERKKPDARKNSKGTFDCLFRKCFSLHFYRCHEKFNPDGSVKSADCRVTLRRSSLRRTSRTPHSVLLASLAFGAFYETVSLKDP